MNLTDFYLSLVVGQLNRDKVYHPDLPIDKVDANAAGQILYAGLAPRGKATSDAVWWIRKYAYDGSGNYTGSTYAEDVAWDDRTSATYT